MKTLVAIAVVLAASVAHAAPPSETAPTPEPPVARPKWMFTVGALLRSTGSDPYADHAIDRLNNYGWLARAPTLFGLRGDVAYLYAPLVDVGAAWSWADGTYAQGPLFDDPDTITASTLELGMFLRLHWVRPSSPAAAEPRVEAGVARTTSTMRGIDDHDVGLYTRVGLDIRLGGRRGGALLSLDYTSIHRQDDGDLDLPTGGVNASLSFYWRRW